MSAALLPFPAFAGRADLGLFARSGRERLPALPSEPARSAYSFGSANHLEAADQRGLRLPAGASALPAVTQDWFQGFFFSLDEMLSYNATTYVIASKGSTGQSVSGASQTGINVRGGVAAGGITPFSLELGATNPFLRSFFPGFTRTQALDRGAPHLAVYGQKGDNPFFVLLRVGHDGRIDPSLVDLQVGASNSGANSWKFASNGSTPAYSAGAHDFLSGFGGNVDMADGANRRAAGGSVAFFFNVWGSFPFEAGRPDMAFLRKIAEGQLDAAGIADAAEGTLRYANHLKGPGQLEADPRGTIVAAALELGTNPKVEPSAVAPLRQPPALRLDTYGDHFVHPMSGTARRGTVSFAGSFEGQAGPGSFEVRLVRVDDGRDLVGWTPIAIALDKASRRFTGTLRDVPAGIAFRRQIRWRRQPDCIFADGDRAGVGIVLVDIGQSQLAYQGYASNTPDGGGGASETPAQSVNTWLGVIKQPFFVNAQSGGGGSLAQAALFRPYASGQHGDGNIHTYETIRRLLKVPVMILDTAVPGTHPNKLSFDRKSFSYGTLFAPDGQTASFTFTPTCPALSTEMEGGSVLPGVVPGTLAIRCGEIAVTDDGQGNLMGDGVIGGTINYASGRITGLTFSAAPPAGLVPAGSFRLFATPTEIGQTPQAGGWSMWGEDERPLDRSNRTGRMMAHLTRLRGVAPSMFRVFWYTSFDGASAGVVEALFNRLKARFAATYPAANDALWGFALPGRSNAGQAEGRTYRPMGEAQRAYALAQANGRILGSFLDMETAANQSPHQSPTLGARTLGERMGVGIAAAFTEGLSVDGPVLTGARFVSTARTAIECAFALAAGRKIVTADGSTGGLQGFRVTPGAQNAWSADGFTAAITGRDRVTLTKTDGAWSPGARIAFGNGCPVTTGGSAQEAADNAGLLRMVFDDDRLFGGETKYAVSGRPGNLARMVDNVPVLEPL